MPKIQGMKVKATNHIQLILFHIKWSFKGFKFEWHWIKSSPPVEPIPHHLVIISCLVPVCVCDEKVSAGHLERSSVGGSDTVAY